MGIPAYKTGTLVYGIMPRDFFNLEFCHHHELFCILVMFLKLFAVLFSVSVAKVMEIMNIAKLFADYFLKK